MAGVFRSMQQTALLGHGGGTVRNRRSWQALFICRSKEAKSSWLILYGRRLHDFGRILWWAVGAIAAISRPCNPAGNDRGRVCLGPHPQSGRRRLGPSLRGVSRGDRWNFPDPAQLHGLAWPAEGRRRAEPIGTPKEEAEVDAVRRKADEQGAHDLGSWTLGGRGAPGRRRLRRRREVPSWRSATGFQQHPPGVRPAQPWPSP